MRLSDSIEYFIKNMISEEEPQIELKRNELAQYFGCAPSQINYVLATRFSPDHGYVIESRRGGGGYIRIVRVVQPAGRHLMYLTGTRIGDSISETQAIHIITSLQEQGTVSPSEADLMKAAISTQALSIPMPEAMKNAVRAKSLRAMLTTIARRNTQKQSTTAAQPDCQV